jgi:hypothetical protein
MDATLDVCAATATMSTCHTAQLSRPPGPDLTIIERERPISNRVLIRSKELHQEEAEYNGVTCLSLHFKLSYDPPSTA